MRRKTHNRTGVVEKRSGGKLKREASRSSSPNDEYPLSMNERMDIWLVGKRIARFR